MSNKFSDLTDDEVSFKIACLKLGEIGYTGIEKTGNLWINAVDSNNKKCSFPCLDYCNNWNDTGPLIKKFKLDVCNNDDLVSNSARDWYNFDGLASANEVHVQIDNNKVLRAICECILLIKDKEGK